MKKIALLSFMSLVVVTTLYSQIKFIPKAGVSYSTVSFSDDIKNYYFSGTDSKTKGKLGLIVGVAVEIPLVGKMLSLQPELLFHQKGLKYEDPGDGVYIGASNGTSTLNYLELPVLVKVKFGKFYAVAGPSFAYGIGGKYENTTNDLYTGTTTNSDGKITFGKEPDNYDGTDVFVDNAVDVAVQVGAGVKISVIVIELRYGIGLSNLYDQPSGYSIDNKSKNGSWQLTVGVPLPLGD